MSTQIDPKVNLRKQLKYADITEQKYHACYT